VLKAFYTFSLAEDEWLARFTGKHLKGERCWVEGIDELIARAAVWRGQTK